MVTGSSPGSHILDSRKNLARLCTPEFLVAFEPVQVRRFLAGDLHTEQLRPRTGLPPLLCRLSDRPPEQLQWLGVSYGLTQQLYNFWSRSAFSPVYLRQAPSEITGSLCPLCSRTKVFEIVAGLLLRQTQSLGGFQAWSASNGPLAYTLFP